MGTKVVRLYTEKLESAVSNENQKELLQLLTATSKTSNSILDANLDVSILST